MNKEQRFFLTCLSDCLNQRATSVPDDIDWNIVEDYAIKHQVEPIIYYQTRNEIFFKAWNFAISFYYNRKKNFTDIFKALADIECFVVKGGKICEFYKFPFLRTMGDIDIVVHTEERGHTNDVLSELGFECISKDNNGEWHYKKGDFEIEVHDRLIFPNNNIFNDCQVEFINNFWKYYNDNEIDINFHFIYIIFHLLKHLKNRGIGFRQFFDVAVLINNVNLDWNWILEKCKELDLLRFLYNVLAFCEIWFNVPVSFSLPEIDSDFFEYTTSLIFENGVFGFDNASNDNANAINRFMNKGRFANFMNIIGLFFPKYEFMCSFSKYGYLKKFPFLLPFSWLSRIFNSKSNFRVKIKNNFINKSDVDNRRIYYNNWGI